jgi:hypothetical protein
MALDIKKEFADIKAMYDAQPRNKTFNALIYGGFGVGKTNILRTCRKPVLVHSFDPGGTKTVRDEIEKGSIIADTRFENEDPFHPTVFKMWDDEYHRLKKGGVFDGIGTYVLDSATTWASAAMNVVLDKGKRAGSQPFQQDYLPAMTLIENAVKDMTTLPCDVILIAHEDVDKDEASGKMFVGPLFVGKLKYRIPILFDEIYYATTKETSQGVSYYLLTRTTGLYRARTRLGKGGIFDTYEVQDIKALLKKAGYSTEDKAI